VKGHKESQCYKKNPEKAPNWWKEKNAKMESALSSIDVTLMSLDDPGKTAVDMIALQAKKDDTLVIFHQENLWICKTGTNTHVMQSNKCTKNT
jgi:hypothetical protein